MFPPLPLPKTVFPRIWSANPFTVEELVHFHECCREHCPHLSICSAPFLFLIDTLCFLIPLHHLITNLTLQKTGVFLSLGAEQTCTPGKISFSLCCFDSSMSSSLSLARMILIPENCHNTSPWLPWPEVLVFFSLLPLWIIDFVYSSGES